MRVKTFEATSMQEALNIVKQDMGEEAFILSTRTKHRKNAMGLGEEPVIEVTAAVDEASDSPQPDPLPIQGNGLYGLRPPLANRAPEPPPRRPSPIRDRMPPPAPERPVAPP
ncbi:MAG: hypothetical protein P4L36_08550, partial [Holophaga sp.]|nr:hypothetical protein [Holophaga sp.]